jgi:hypothetical protein
MDIRAINKSAVDLADSQLRYAEPRVAGSAARLQSGNPDRVLFPAPKRFEIKHRLRYRPDINGLRGIAVSQNVRGL